MFFPKKRKLPLLKRDLESFFLPVERVLYLPALVLLPLPLQLGQPRSRRGRGLLLLLPTALFLGGRRRRVRGAPTGGPLAAAVGRSRSRVSAAGKGKGK